MKITLLKIHCVVKNLLLQEEGQDLIEYALLVALVAFGATAGMTSLANAINNAFNAIGATLTSSI